MGNLLKIRQIRQNLTREACETLISGLVLSHLDYCNGILINLPSVTIHKLQRIQNIAAKLILKRGWMDSPRKAILDLRWLCIVHQIDHKILCLIHKCLYGNVPNYLKDLLTINPGASRTLRSNSNIEMTLIIPKTTRKTFAARSFSVYGPLIWNKLPKDLRLIKVYEQFKSKIKTHLFTKQGKDYYDSV